MTSKELGAVLEEMYNNAPRGEQVTMVHLFGIKFSEEIKKYGVKEVVEEAKIHSTYATELSKAVKLSKYVTPKN